MKKSIFILAGLCFFANGFAQQAQPAHLLGFSGKLIRPNTLLTPQGDTIFYEPAKNQVRKVSRSGMGKRLDGMLAELGRTSRRIDEAVQRMTASLPRPLLPEMSAAVTQAYTSLEEKWKPILSNTYILPAGDFRQGTRIINGKGGVNEFTGEEEDRFEEILIRIRAFMAAHKDDDLGSLLPVPPRYNFSYCFPCDSIAGKRFEEEKNQFLASVMATDADLHTEALGMCQFIQRSFGDALYRPVNDKIRKQHDEAWAFHDFVLKRGAERAILLLDKYLDDPYRLGTVMEFVLRTDRELQLMGTVVREETAFKNRDYLPAVMETMNRFFLNAFREKDYTIGLNFRLILAQERTNQLLGLYKKEQNLLEELLRFNQFKVNSNITAKLGQDAGYIMGHVRGDNWFYALPDKNTCRLNWIMAFSRTDRLARYKLIAAEAGGGYGEYVGTSDWQSQPPVFKMDFCYKEGEEVEDSILANTFHPEGFREKWKYPDPIGTIEVEQVSGALMACFIDLEQIKKEAESLNREKIDKMRQDLQNKYAKIAASGVGAMNNMPAQMQADMDKLNREIRELLAKSHPVKYLFKPHVNNKDASIFKERLNGREIFPENPAIEYAWFHLTMEHDPDGPYPLGIYLFNTLRQL